MLNSPLGGRRGIGFGLGRSWQRESADWWLSGGIPAANCIAAYQPKGAASYAASKSNLANPGTYDAYEGVAPDWDAVNGWGFNGISQYLNTGVIPSSGWSMIVRFSNGADSGDDREMCGSRNSITDTRFRIAHRITDGAGGYLRAYMYGSENQLAQSKAAVTSGVMAITPTFGYYNGAEDYAIVGTWSGAGVQISVGAYFGGGTSWLGYYQGDIQAFAVYNTTLTSIQVSALTDAMNAL